MVKKKTAIRALVYIIITTHVLIIIFPFIWMGYSSFKTNPEFFASVWSLPESLSFENIRNAWGTGALGRYITNSVVVTIGAVTITLIVAVLGGFSLGFHSAKWMSFAKRAFIFAMAVPPYVSLVPLVITLRNLNLLDTRLGLILPTAAFNVPMSVFIMRSFFLAIPREVEEAAYVDGATPLQAFGRVILPLAKPAIFTVAILNVIWVWNEFLFALVIVTKPSLKTLPVGLRDFVGEHITHYPVMLSAILIAVLPALVIFVVFRRQIVAGLSAGAVKG